MSSRRIEDLDPRCQDRARLILRAWENANLDVLVTCTLRSNEEQEQLYAQGRTTPGFIVTHARAGESFHNPAPGRGACAIDVVPLVHGRADWKYTPADPEDYWDEIVSIARGADPSVVWGGSWAKPKTDMPHFQWSIG